MKDSGLEIEILRGDVFDVAADLLLLKYAIESTGLDLMTSRALVAEGFLKARDLRSDPGAHVFSRPLPQWKAKELMFLGAGPLWLFQYDVMRGWARRAAEIISSERPAITHVATTLHGVGYGLDAGEAFQSLVRGFLEGSQETGSARLSRVTFVDRDVRLVRAMSTALAGIGIGKNRQRGEDGADQPTPSWFSFERAAKHPDAPDPVSREHVFVAIPFSREFEDVYEFGIYEPVRRCGYICERVDHSSFTGNVLDQIRLRIQEAKLVIADLSGGRPNVYLEVGYAWGRDIPVIFLARKGEQLHFDVKLHRCIFYETIGQLARDLEKLVRGLGTGAETRRDR